MLLATLVLLFSVVLLLAMVVVTRQSPRCAASEEHFASSSHATTADAVEDAKHNTHGNGVAKDDKDNDNADNKGDTGATTVMPSWVQAEHQRDDRGRVEDSSTILMHGQDQRAMPELETFDHHEPDRSVLAREYGMDYVPPEVWSVPQHRPPQCYHSVSKPCHECPSALSTPFTSVQEAAEQTAVGSILPTFTYREDRQVA